MVPRACGEAPFCIGCLWQGIEAMFRGLIPIPYLLRRLRRSRVYGGFVFCFGFVRGRFRVVSLVSPPALSLLRRGFVFAKLTIFLEFCGNIENLAPTVCRVWEAFRVY